MEPLIQTESELKKESNKHNIVFSVSDTNEEIAYKLLKRQVLQQEIQKPIPFIPEQVPTNLYGFPEIEWKEMSCYIDALVMNMIQSHPKMSKLLSLSTTYLPHKNPLKCQSEIERVRETWRQTIFLLLQKKRTSLRPFLKTLVACSDSISEETPFWRGCLNDPLEFLKNTFIPILMISSDGVLEGPYRERKTYKNVEEHAKIEPKVFGDVKKDANVVLQVVNVGLEEIQNGKWFTNTEPLYTLKDVFNPESDPVYITREDWEFKSDTKEFIFKKDTEEERRIPESERTDEIGSKVTEINTDVTLFHPKADVICIGLQKILSEIAMEEVALTISKGESIWDMTGAIIFKRAHYTAIFKHDTEWYHYDSFGTHTKLKEEDAIEKIRKQARCLIYGRR